jgi:hypothetical protein
MRDTAKGQRNDGSPIYCGSADCLPRIGCGTDWPAMCPRPAWRGAQHRPGLSRGPRFARPVLCDSAAAESSIRSLLCSRCGSGAPPPSWPLAVAGWYAIDVFGSLPGYLSHVGQWTWLLHGDGISSALALLLGAAALALSPGPRRGMEILTAKSWLVLIGPGAAMGLTQPYLGRDPCGSLPSSS